MWKNVNKGNVYLLINKTALIDTEILTTILQESRTEAPKYYCNYFISLFYFIFIYIFKMFTI